LNHPAAYSHFLKLKFLLIVFVLIAFNASAAGIDPDTTPTSTQAEALAYIDQLPFLSQSSHWPNVKPDLFIQNLRKDVMQPLSLYEGRSTNFCAYAALSYLPLHHDPLRFVEFMIDIYQHGKSKYGKAVFEPTPEVKRAAGTLRFKGELDIRPADQLWFLVLADHFKGYLNFYDKHFNPGDENKLWAAVNFAKFNRMIRVLFNFKVSAIGSDLIRPGIRDIYEYLSERLQQGNLALFVNNLSLYKKNHTKLRLGVPTHFVILLKMEWVDDRIAVTYWDYGGRSLQLLSPAFLKRIIFGISLITPKTAYDN
jgi:hypothetical protein